MNKTFAFIFQTIFFTVTFFLMHLAFFDFYSTYRKSPELFYSTFENWLPVLVFDFLVGLTVGLFISAFSVTINKNEKALRNLIILTDLIWLVFCFYWYFNNNGATMNTEAIGHVISPILVGLVGGILAILNLIISIVANRNLKEN